MIKKISSFLLLLSIILSPFSALAADTTILPTPLSLSKALGLFVPYTGATSDVDLGSFSLSAYNLTTTNGTLNFPNGSLTDNGGELDWNGTSGMAIYTKLKFSSSGVELQDNMIDGLTITGSLALSGGDLTLENAKHIRFYDNLGTPLSVLQLFSDNNVYLDSPTGLNIRTNLSGGAVSALSFATNGDATFATKVGIGTSPSYPLDVRKTFSTTQSSNNNLSNFVATINPPANEGVYATRAGLYQVIKAGSFNLTGSIGLRGLQLSTDNTGSGAVSEAAAFLATVANSGSGTITSGYGAYIFSPSASPSSPITNAYGMFINSQKVSGVTTGYGIWQAGTTDINYLAGKVGINTASPGSQLQVNALDASTIGQIIKGYTSQTANLTQWQDSAGTNLLKVDAAGQIGYNMGTTALTKSLTINNTDNTTGAIQVKTGAGILQTTNIFDYTQQSTLRTKLDGYGQFWNLGSVWVGSMTDTDYTAGHFLPLQVVNTGNNAVVGSFSSSYATDDRALLVFKSKTGPIMYYGSNTFGYGFYGAGGAIATPPLTIEDNTGARKGRVGINTGASAAGAQLQINTFDSGVIGQIVKGSSSQTADLFQTQNSAGTALTRFLSDGSITGLADSSYFSWDGAAGFARLGFIKPAADVPKLAYIGSLQIVKGSDTQSIAPGLNTFSTVMTFDSSNNMGIGTVSPLSKLHLVTGNSDGLTFTYNNGNQYRSNIGTQFTGSSAPYTYLFVKVSDGTTTGGNSTISFHGNGGVAIGQSYAANGANAVANGLVVQGNVGIGNTAPNSSLQVSGSLSLAYVAKTANYTLGASDYTVNCTANSFDITFPTAVGIQGREYFIKNTGTGIITLKTTSAQTIDGNASGVLTLVQWDSIVLVSDGANWIIKN